jgi:hypothetical protein
MRGMPVRLLAAASMLVAGAVAAQAQAVKTANTVDDPSGVFAGQAVAGLVVMGKPCTFGNSYHYQITSRRDLRVEGPIACPGGGIIANQVNGNELICRLDAELRCEARPAAAAALIPYVVDAGGVRVGEDELIAWADAQQAAALLALLHQAGEPRKNDQ